MPRTIWKKFNDRHNDLHKMERSMETLGDLMRPGTYRVTPRIAYRDRSIENRLLATRGWNQELDALADVGAMRRWSHRVRGFCRFVEVNGRSSPNGDETVSSQGSILLPGRRKSILLDPHGKQVLMVYGSQRAFEAHSNRPGLLAEHFPPPAIHHVDQKRRIVVEALGEGRYREQWGPEDWRAAEAFVWDRSGAYLAAAVDHGSPLWGASHSVRDLFDELRAFPEYVELSESIRHRFRIERLSGERFPWVHGHGDLKMENLLRRGDEWLVLDWEFSRPHLFFFDLLHWIYREARYFMNLGPIQRYMEGGMDEELADRFETAGVRFDPEARAGYLGLYLMDWLCDRGRERGSASRWKQADYHRRFMDRLQAAGVLR